MKILIALPVYNEEKQLSKNVNKLYSFLEKSLPYSFQNVIADNNSTDGTSKIGKD
jgi:glycosyltransferase involved in cell wall biosynthesis